MRKLLLTTALTTAIATPAMANYNLLVWQNQVGGENGNLGTFASHQACENAYAEWSKSIFQIRPGLQGEIAHVCPSLQTGLDQ